jgi:16S rRNA (cytosine967-C5)-methyltransferase
MTPAARVAAAIDILGDILAALEGGGASADVILKAAWRTRRYAGSKDRAAISDLVYGVLRRKAALTQALGDAPVTARTLMLAALVWDGADIPALFSGEGYGPAALTAEEKALVHQLAPSDNVLEIPSWLMPHFTRRFGERLAAEVNALNGRAPLDIRVNTKRIPLGEAQAQLRQSGIDTETLPHAPAGLRAAAGANVTATTLYHDGLIEIQDAAAQRASMMAVPEQGGLVADLCAGAGGKSLAVAAACAAPLRIEAFDVDARRLQELKVRAARAGVDNIHATLLSQSGKGRVQTLTPLTAQADVVMVDAPCSGTGTWRRNPEAKWRLTPQQLADYATLQMMLLTEGASLVKPGGRLVYMTCSVLMEEDEDIVTGFMAAHDDFSWIGQTLLTPARDDTDGFYMAVLKRVDSSR